ncbi:MAG: methionine adenosyltransferase domain-containing protein, partial [Alistipes sp.]|nr:methionine adenosyltransferase domain-containing protein [Alistipes sp.]
EFAKEVEFFSWEKLDEVDRSAAYAARHIAKNMVAAGIAREVLVQVSYAIGIAQPLSIYVDTYGTSNVKFSDGEIAERIGKLFDLRPAAIVERFGLKYPIFEATASYGHFGRRPYSEMVRFVGDKGKEFAKEVEFFSWEKLDEVDHLKQEFGL